MTAPLTVIRFPDRRTAYSFVAELRRLYDFDRFAALRVHSSGREVLVELPAGSQPAAGIADLAERHGGRPATGPEELTRLRDAVTTARDIARGARSHIERPARSDRYGSPAVDRSSAVDPSAGPEAGGVSRVRLEPPEPEADRLGGPEAGGVSRVRTEPPESDRPGEPAGAPESDPDRERHRLT